ncbi:MAG: polyprenyl synthetase family protein [Legionella sp.]|jgi:octaprenyl-diphosphate synthase
MTINRIRTLVQDDFDAVNHLIISKIQSQINLVDDLSKHIVESGGKRLRPLLVLLASKACGYQGDGHIALAATVEFIHTATLLHDDVVDDSTLRRGKKTANSIWGSKASILVGDYLFTQSMQLMVDVGNFEVIKLITDSSFKISCGEVKQLANRHNPLLSFEEYFEVIRAKTALLFASAAAIGPLLINSSTSLKENLYAYGLHLGNAFQLIDDALDYCSDAETLGKNIGDDLADGKATLPIIHALQHGTKLQQEQIKQSLQQGSLEFLPEILQALKDTKAIEYTRQIAAQEVDSALSCLHVLPDSEYKTALIDLANFAVERSY